ncbi:hypothetical protein TVAG_052660 [Trichomonas vaginalis G3]|uniref:Uncharacterized protein n=1 Tax=Trichomonas vaginalis (strain ATCC PRA-98 / G3) TaxID=412133 RepID=A2G5Z0_TRIV3|nr:hypothetical protein TVAGG3_0654740 [Trichomonas vaginalis G3]EAX87430.1 hypothetical protein TVAG_052660 [Trichomonas vaginalis G3]KAI5506094.1 hypothetical protein TVAGG3_0654740 [Trichomonas vaginalis G3]|eukprot:XP_001300360.1 hypothetical protein [Trichomonas vaginalis G3]
MEKRMKFATQAGTLEHTLDLNINPYSTSTRIAKEISTKICCKKDGQYVNISIGKVVATTYIRSEVVTTTSSTFLWWEWDKSTTIEWRPLTGSELSQVEDYLSNLAHIYDFRMNEVTY